MGVLSHYYWDDLLHSNDNRYNSKQMTKEAKWGKDKGMAEIKQTEKKWRKKRRTIYLFVILGL